MTLRSGMLRAAPKYTCWGIGEVNTTQLAEDEPLSPELVLVLTPERRAQVLASMPPPAWSTPRPQARRVQLPTPPEPRARALGAFVLARVALLTLIFVVCTILTLAMSALAHSSSGSGLVPTRPAQRGESRGRTLPLNIGGSGPDGRAGPEQRRGARRPRDTTRSGRARPSTRRRSPKR